MSRLRARACEHTLRADCSSLLAARVWWVRLTARVQRALFGRTPFARAGGLAASHCARPASTLSTTARNDQSCVRDARAREPPQVPCAILDWGMRDRACNHTLCEVRPSLHRPVIRLARSMRIPSRRPRSLTKQSLYPSVSMTVRRTRVVEMMPGMAIDRIYPFAVRITEFPTGFSSVGRTPNPPGGRHAAGRSFRDRRDLAIDRPGVSAR